MLAQVLAQVTNFGKTRAQEFTNTAMSRTPEGPWNSRENQNVEMTPLQNDPQPHEREAKKTKMSRLALERMEPRFGICTPRALEIRSRFSL
jgi:hypothetical protein